MFSSSDWVTLLYGFGKGFRYVYRRFWIIFFDAEFMGLYGGIVNAGLLLSRFDLSPGLIRAMVGFGKDKKRRAGLFSWVFFAGTLCYLLIGGLGYLFLDPIQIFFFPKFPSFRLYLPIIFVLGYLIALNILMKSWCRGLGFVLFPNVLHHLFLSVFLLSNLALYHFHKSKIFFLYGTLGCYILLLICFLYFLWWSGFLYFSPFWRVLEPSFFASFIRHGIFVLLSHGVVLILPRLDQVMVLGHLGGRAAALYGAAVYFALFFEIPVKITRQLVDRGLSIALQKGDQIELSRLLQSGFTHLLSLSFYLVLIFSTSIAHLLNTLLGDTYATDVNHAVSIFWILTLAELLSGAFQFYHIVVIQSKYYIISLFCIVLVVLGIIGNYIGIGQHGMWGVALATLMVMTLGVLFFGSFVWYKFRVHLFSTSVWHLFVLLAVLFLVDRLLSLFLFSFWGVILRVIGLSIGYWGVLYHLGLSKYMIRSCEYR